MRGPRKLSKKEYYRIYSKAPRTTVDLIIFHENGLILSKRDIPPCKGMWHLPGGTILLGENLTQAAKRISREETGLKIDPLGIVGIKEYSRKAAFGQVIAFVLLAKEVGGRLRGNEYAREVKPFNRLPSSMIKEQRDMLISLGIVDGDGSLKFSKEDLNIMERKILVRNKKLWRMPT